MVGIGHCGEVSYACDIRDRAEGIGGADAIVVAEAPGGSACTCHGACRRFYSKLAQGEFEVMTPLSVTMGPVLFSSAPLML